MTQEEYINLRDQIETDFNSVYRRIDDCGTIVEKEEYTIRELKASITELKIEQAKTNTRLSILIAILSPIAVSILSVCVKLLFNN